LKFHVKKKH